MLSDVLVERYSRQILLPEVGGRGQERLCAARLVVAGDDEASRFAVALLARAGASVSSTPHPAGEIRVSAAASAGVVGRWHATAAAVATVVRAPCLACFDASRLALPEPGTSTTSPALAQATGALVAAETLRLLLGLATSGRIQTIDLAHGTTHGGPLSPTAGCPHCGVAA
jgi:hypothetical protein